MPRKKPEPIKVYGVLAKIKLADSNNEPDTKTEPTDKSDAKRRSRSRSQPTK